MFCKALAIFTVLGAFNAAQGYELGAPEEACIDMIPQHHTPPQTSPFPYSLTVDKKEVKSGGKVNVVITGTEAAKTFKGFFVQAKVGETTVGKFDSAPLVKLVDCGGSKSSGATHVSPEVKNKVVLTWNAPPGLSENVRFKATVAQDGGTFWVGHLSSPLVVKS